MTIEEAKQKLTEMTNCDLYSPYDIIVGLDIENLWGQLDINGITEHITNRPGCEIVRTPIELKDCILNHYYCENQIEGKHKDYSMYILTDKNSDVIAFFYTTDLQ